MRKRDWKALIARQDYLTGDEMRRILDDESPVRVWREKRGLSQRALAEQARVSASYLAEIETGKKPGSAEALRKLSRVLTIPMENLGGGIQRWASVRAYPFVACAGRGGFGLDDRRSK